MKLALTPEQITKVWNSMPGGTNRFMKDWGYQTFARALMEEANREPHISVACDSTVIHAEESMPNEPLSTPPNRWAEQGESDPHGIIYDCERAQLTLGSYTDDELANGAFMNYDQRLSFEDMIHPKPGKYMPLVWMTAVKDRIRWLSRALVKAQTPTKVVELKDDQIRTIESDQAKTRGVTRDNLDAPDRARGLIAQHGFCAFDDECTCARDFGYRVCQPGATTQTAAED